MMDLEKLIAQLKKLLTSSDLTDSAELHDLAAEYRQRSQEFNEAAGKCRQYLARKMTAEALNYAETLQPTLARQHCLLMMPERKELSALCDLYGLEALPPLEEDVLPQLNAAAAGLQDISPLLSEYRKIARDGALSSRIALLRRIVALNSAEEWRSTLAQLETQQFNLLAQQAKEAILAEDLTTLQSVKLELESPEWQSPPLPVVMEKIQREEHRLYLKEVDRNASALLERVNDAYAAFDYKTLESSLEQLHSVLDREPEYQLNEAKARQLAEADHYYAGQKKIHDADAEYRELLALLKQGLEERRPFPQLEMLATRIQLAGRELPEQVQKRYLTYQEDTESARRRKMILKAVGISAASLAGIALVSALVLWGMDLYSERRWVVQIEKALAQNYSKPARQLFDQMVRELPQMQERQSLIALEARIREMEEDEKGKQALFSSTVRTIQEMRKDYAKNYRTMQGKMQIAAQLAVSPEDQRLLRELQHECDRAHTRFSREQDLKYAQIAAEVSLARSAFFTALERDNVPAAEQQLQQIRFLQARGASLDGVSDSAKQSSRDTMTDVADLTPKIRQTEEFLRERYSFQQRMENPSNIQTLNYTVKEFLTRFPYRKECAQFQKFSARDLALGTVLYSGIRQNLIQHPLFKDDNLFLEKNDAPNRTIGKTLTDVMNQATEGMRKNYSYAFILQNQDGNLFSAIFPRGTKISWARDTDSSTISLACFSDDAGHTLNVSLRKKDRSDVMEVYLKNNPNTPIFTGKLIFPRNVTRGQKNTELAPHLDFQLKLNDQLLALPPAEREGCFCRGLAEFIADKRIEPVQKCIIAKSLLTHLQKANPANQNYQKFQDSLSRIQQQIPKGFSWFNPGDTIYGWEIQKRLQEQVAELDPASIVPLEDPVIAASRIALSRKLKAVGYLRIPEDGKKKFIRFPHTQEEGELWLLSKDGTRLQQNGKYRKDTLTPFDFADFPRDPGYYMIFSPTDGRNTAEMEKALLQKMQTINGRETWPASWPKHAGGWR